ncbi:Glucan endo-1-3-beta-glucosidase 8 [Striga hermonthica]|uniref:Glucan endo-1-3-beta-glucosidase 8 n=1 Tax=Striga hermonthica TaxID=68872 RepID=A0A9N7MPF8_STRHE|nr:Glucan endo-1-3-beta-glucosidase 8 [Striga hermonthica]
MTSKTMNIHSPSYILAIFIAITSVSNNVVVTEGRIGINWGRATAQRLIPSVVVDLLLQNHVPAARVYSSEEDLLQAFVGSGIDLSITIPKWTDVATYDLAQDWVRQKSPWFGPSNVTCVMIGTEIFGLGMNDTELQRRMIDAFNYTQLALNDAGYGHVKATFPHPLAVLDEFKKPSEAVIRESVRTQFLRHLDIVRASGAPVNIEFFPVELMRVLNITDLSFAIADGRSSHAITDIDGAVYTDVFEFSYDAFAWALEKLGYGDVKFVVTQVGWPTDGFVNANFTTAERFLGALLPFVASGRGTHKLPGKPIDIYVHALTDENLNPPFLAYGRHWGIYRSNGEPKYRVDLTGQGRVMFPARARGIRRMPKRWCVLGPMEDEDDKRVEEAYQFACATGDCTSMYPKGSCSGLDRWQNVSYAFNMYFQAFFQDEAACKFDGLGQVVTEDPSTVGCVFPVEVVKGQQENFKNATESVATGKENRARRLPGLDGNLVLLVSALWALLLLHS